MGLIGSLKESYLKRSLIFCMSESILETPWTFFHVIPKALREFRDLKHDLYMGPATLNPISANARLVCSTFSPGGWTLHWNLNDVRLSL